MFCSLNFCMPFSCQWNTRTNNAKILLRDFFLNWIVYWLSASQLKLILYLISEVITNKIRLLAYSSRYFQLRKRYDKKDKNVRNTVATSDKSINNMCQPGIRWNSKPVYLKNDLNFVRIYTNSYIPPQRSWQNYFHWRYTGLMRLTIHGVLWGYPKSIRRHDGLSAKFIRKVIRRKNNDKIFLHDKKILRKIYSYNRETIWYFTDSKFSEYQ